MKKRILISIVVIVIVIVGAIAAFLIMQMGSQNGKAWWNDSWSYRNKLTFQNIDQPETLMDFPVLVDLSLSNFDYSKTKDDGTDLRFVDTDDSTELKYHIEKWDPLGQSYIWVKVPGITANSNSDYIWMYYGNPGASDIQNESATYDSNFKIVQHMQELTGIHYDSTANNNDGTPYGVSYIGSSGKIDGAYEFDGFDDYIDYGNDNSLDIDATITIEAWVWLNSQKPGVISAKPGAYYLEIDYEYKLVGGIYDNDDWHRVIGSTTISINKWYYTVLIYDGINLKLYLNGNLDGESEYIGSISPFLTNNFYVGNQIFIDDFSDYPDGSKGEPTYFFEDYAPAHNQTIENGAYRWHSPVARNETISIIKGFFGKDYIAEVRAKTGSKTGGAYICGRFDTVEDKFEAVLDTQWNNAVLNKVVGNFWTNIETKSLGWTVQNNTWYTLKTQIETEGSTNRIKVWIDNVLQIEQTDSDLMEYPGLAILAYDFLDPYDIYFDDFKVYIPFNGMIDEVRISDTARSPNWIKAQHQSMNNDFISYGNKETRGVQVVLSLNVSGSMLTRASDDDFAEVSYAYGFRESLIIYQEHIN